MLSLCPKKFCVSDYQPLLKWYLHTYIHAYLHIHTCIPMHTYTYMYTYLHTHTCIPTYMYTYLDTHPIFNFKRNGFPTSTKCTSGFHAYCSWCFYLVYVYLIRVTWLCRGLEYNSLVWYLFPNIAQWGRLNFDVYRWPKYSYMYVPRCPVLQKVDSEEWMVIVANTTYDTPVPVYICFV